jgi:hypothetical protein
MLIYLRKSETRIMGFRLGLILGSIPAECLLLSLLIGQMAVRELAQMEPDLFQWAMDVCEGRGVFEE